VVRLSLKSRRDPSNEELVRLWNILSGYSRGPEGGLLLAWLWAKAYSEEISGFHLIAILEWLECFERERVQEGRIWQTKDLAAVLEKIGPPRHGGYIHIAEEIIRHVRNISGKTLPKHHGIGV
jgi:hypothetical protein